MPVTFHEREQAFEAKFAHDAEFRFRVTARRDKLFAHWAAEALALSAEDGEALVRGVLAVADTPGHDETVVQHIAGVFAAHRHEPSAEALSAALARCAKQARQQLLQKPADQPDTP